MFLVSIPLLVFISFVYYKKFLTKKISYIFISIISVFSICIASDYIIDYDAYLYHLQSIHWLENDALAIGLSNLHQRLAFTSIWFNFHSIFGFSNVFQYPLAIYNSLLLPLLSVLLIKESENKNDLLNKIPYFFIPIALLLLSASQPMYRILRGYSPDVPVMILTITWFFTLLKNKQTFRWIYILLLVSLTTLLIKLSGILLVIFSVFIFISKFREIQPTKKQLKFYFTVLMLFISYFIINNILKSGYLVYPLSFTKVPVFWAENTDKVKDLQGIISSWAKTESINSDYFGIFNLSWVSTWIVKKSFSELILLATSILGIGQTLYVGFIKKIPIYKITSAFLLVLFLYWFLIAPDFRFGYGILISSIFVGLASLRYLNLKKKIFWIFYAILFSLFIFTNKNVMNYTYWLRAMPLLQPKGLRNFNTNEVTLDNAVYYLPVEGSDQTNYTDFPSTPELDKCLIQEKVWGTTIFYTSCN